MLHRAIYGSLERFMGILLEHTSGNLPVWLSPVQARIISFTDRNKESVKKFYEKMKEAGIRTDIDLGDETVNNKVRNAEMMKIPYILVIGDKEEEGNTIAVRRKGKKPEFGVKEDNLIKEIKEKIEIRE